MIRVFLIDPHPAIRTGVREFFRETEMDAVADAESVNEASLKLARYRAEILVTEINLGIPDPVPYLQRVRTLLDPPARVIVYATDASTFHVARAAAAGVVDYISKTAPKETLLEAIRAAKIGRSPIYDGEMYRYDKTRTRHEGDAPNHSLTEREVEVLQHVALGLSNRQIAQTLGIQPDTVKEHVRNILRKNAFTDRTQAAVWGVRLGIVPE